MTQSKDPGPLRCWRLVRLAPLGATAPMLLYMWTGLLSLLTSF